MAHHAALHNSPGVSDTCASSRREPILTSQNALGNSNTTWEGTRARAHTSPWSDKPRLVWSRSRKIDANQFLVRWQAGRWALATERRVLTYSKDESSRRESTRSHKRGARAIGAFTKEVFPNLTR